jgi:HSP20 family molecular chaperone IbpA
VVSHRAKVAASGFPQLLNSKMAFPNLHLPDATMGPATGRYCPTLHRRSASRSLKQEDTNMRSAFDFAPFRRSTVGFDRLFDMLENSNAGQAENYPPFDLIKLGDNDYRIELAVAGFKPGEIDITAQQNVLVVSGRKGEETTDNENNYIYRGIATRSFERRHEGRAPVGRARSRDPGGDETEEDQHRRAACFQADGRRRGR